jgi:hypothetical protein
MASDLEVLRIKLELVTAERDRLRAVVAAVAICGICNYCQRRARAALDVSPYTGGEDA